jgi:hypothetical protein
MVRNFITIVLGLLFYTAFVWGASIPSDSHPGETLRPRGFASARGSKFEVDGKPFVCALLEWFREQCLLAHFLGLRRSKLLRMSLMSLPNQFAEIRLLKNGDSCLHSGFHFLQKTMISKQPSK